MLGKTEPPCVLYSLNSSKNLAHALVMEGFKLSNICKVNSTHSINILPNFLLVEWGLRKSWAPELWLWLLSKQPHRNPGCILNLNFVHKTCFQWGVGIFHVFRVFGCLLLEYLHGYSVFEASWNYGFLACCFFQPHRSPPRHTSSWFKSTRLQGLHPLTGVTNTLSFCWPCGVGDRVGGSMLCYKKLL